MILNRKIKLVSINLLLTFLCSIVASELYLRIIRPKFPMEVFGSSYPRRLNQAEKSSYSNSLLTVVVGDSFAHHKIGTDGNFFDSVFSCKKYDLCNYHNLAQSGEGLPFYWNSILKVLSNRGKSLDTKIIISVYFGNDIPFLTKSSNTKICNEIHKYDPALVSKHKDNLIHSIKRSFPSLLFIARGLKASFGLGAQQSTQTIFSNARELRLFRSDANNNLASVEELASKLDQDIINQALKDIINPWEISLALANPYYYYDLYNLNGEWSKKSVDCLLENLISNVNVISKNNPNTKFLVIGIPDKFYWSPKSYHSSIKEYKEIGYRFKANNNLELIKQNPLAILVKDKLKSNLIPYIYLPDLISQDTDIIDWFYKKDMHINTKGNQIISGLLNEIRLWE